jgi:hypothetical protein
MRNQLPNRSQGIYLLHMETFVIDHKVITNPASSTPPVFFPFQTTMPFLYTQLKCFRQASKNR